MIRGGSDAEYVDPSITSTGSAQTGSEQAGYLIYAAASTLRAVRFDSVRLEVLNDPVPVIDPVLTSPAGAAKYAVSRPGTLVYAPGGAGVQTSLVWVDRKGREEPIKAPLRDYNTPRLSPNGRYLAYQSNESGRVEVYVRPFPKVESGRWQVSTEGGTRAAWARNGRELFYLDESKTLTAVPVETSGSIFTAGTPAKVFDAIYSSVFPARHYDVSPDGQRFLMMKERAATPASLIVVEHWFEELKGRVPPPQ